MKASCTDEEFIALWAKLQSTKLVSEALGIAQRSVAARRARLERVKGILLPTAPQAGTRHMRPQDKHHLGMSINEARQFINLSIHDGTLVIGSDAHYSPGIYSTAHAGMLRVIEQLRPDAVILNGDILDGQTAGRWARIGWQETYTVKQELDAVQERLGELEAVAKGAKLLRTIGNHDLRFDSLLSANAGQFEGIAGFRLRDHLPLWQEAWRIEVNTDTVILHDWHSGIHSAWNDVMKSGGYNVVTGHTHELTVKTHRGFGGNRYGVKTGMLAEEDQRQFDYRGGKPGLNWQSGFAVLTWKDGELLYPELAYVHKGQCYFRGQAVTEREAA
jgi:predicted phosphodiesterase